MGFQNQYFQIFVTSSLGNVEFWDPERQERCGDQNNMTHTRE